MISRATTTTAAQAVFLCLKIGESMTTIVFKDGILAADSQVTSGSMIKSTSFNKLFVPSRDFEWTIFGDNVIAFALSGNVRCVLEMKSMLSSGMCLRTKFKENFVFDSIVVTEKKLFLVYSEDSEEDVSFIESQEHFSCTGSGAYAASMFIRINPSCTANEAVQFAISQDVYSGGDVKSINLEKWKPLIE